jgi:hypothetical protein
MTLFNHFLALLVMALVYSSPALAAGKKETTTSLRVTATAYNSLPGQTDNTPDLAAWGDRLRPGMKAIAVSRDLL